jgi:hypothetical protein
MELERRTGTFLARTLRAARSLHRLLALLRPTQLHVDEEINDL